MEKRKFGGVQIGAGRPKKPEGQAQKTLTFGASKECEDRIERQRGTFSRGKAICAMSILAERHPAEYQAILTERDNDT